MSWFILLLDLQVYKSTGNIEAARAMYSKYSHVPATGAQPFAQWRSLILAKKQPRKMFVQSNTRLQGINSHHFNSKILAFIIEVIFT